MKAEERLHQSICTYLKYEYPTTYFLSDPSGIKMTIGQATKLKKTRSKHAQLDIVILEPKGGYCGLIMELKKDRSEVYRKDMTFRNNAHNVKQRLSMEHLTRIGYKVTYVFDFDEAIIILNEYMTL